MMGNDSSDSDTDPIGLRSGRFVSSYKGMMNKSSATKKQSKNPTGTKPKKSMEFDSLLFPRNSNFRSRSPLKVPPQPRGFSAPGATGGYGPPDSPFAQMNLNDDEEDNVPHDVEFQEYLRWKKIRNEGRGYTMNDKFQRNIADDYRKNKIPKDKKKVYKKPSQIEDEAYMKSYVQKKSKPKVRRYNDIYQFNDSDTDHETIVIDENEGEGNVSVDDDTSDSENEGFMDIQHFNPISNPGPPQYYRMFPTPWNTVPDYEAPKDSKLLNTILNSHLIPKMKDCSHLSYVAWRGGFISNIHRMNCPLITKIQAIISLMSDAVKQRVGQITSYTPQNYLRIVRRLEEKFGSPKDLVREMTDNIKKIRILKVGKITDLERYEQHIEEYLSALRTAGRRSECKAENTLQHIIQPLPMFYQNQYQEFLNRTGRNDHAVSLHKWVRMKIQDLISVHRRRGKSPENEDHKKTNDDVKRNYVHNVNDDKSCQDGLIDQTPAVSCESVGESGAKDDEDVDEYEDEWFSFLTAPKVESKVCKLCSKPSKEADHFMRNCPLMSDLPESANRAIFKEFGMCFRCGRIDGHGAKECKLIKCCTKCDSKFHHTLLHNKKKKQ